MQPSIVYDDIFALIKVLQPGHAVLQCEQYGGHLNRQQSLELIQLDDGTVTAITRLPGMTYYRGENQEFPTCLSNLHRIKELEKRTILQVKACDFELYLLQDKLIQENMKNNMHVDLMALAQHYGFPTPMLDITNDIIVAAFFALGLSSYLKKLCFSTISSSEGKKTFIQQKGCHILQKKYEKLRL